MKNILEIKVYRSPFLFFIRMVFIMFSIKICMLIVILAFSLSKWFLFISMLFEVLIVTMLFITWSTNYYKITQTYIIHKKGILFTKEDSFNINSIDNITSYHTLL